MAITDLTNTTWNIHAGWTASAGYGQFNINLYFDDDNSYEFYYIYIGYGISGEPGDFTYPSTSNSIVFNGSSWPTYTSTSSFTITITGGTDATNNKLISWLEANGTQVIDMTPKEQFINQLNELSDAINEKSKTSGKMTISQMIETLGNESVIIPESKPKEQFYFLFNSLSDTINEKAGTSGKLTISQMIENVKSIVIEEETNYLTFSSPSTFTLSTSNSEKAWSDTIEYSTDTTTWNTWDGTTTLNSSADGKLYMRGTGNTKITGATTSSESYWVLTGSNIACKGNIENLLDYKTVENGEHPTMETYCYGFMFYNCTALVEAPVLPATILTNYCYYYMFAYCTSLTEAPVLPATTLASSCYSYMFSGCDSLTVAPELPATMLTDYCYRRMFSSCSSLITAPKLPATTLANYCYQSMFDSCDALIIAPELPATILASRCYQGMFAECDNLLEPPKMSVSEVADGCFYLMFNECPNIQGAIDLTNVSDFTASGAISNFSTNYFPIIRLGTKLTSISTNLYQSEVASATSVGFKFEFTDSDTPQFDTTNYLAKGTNKSTRSYKIYTDNTTIKDGALSQADSATTVNVYHLDGSDWGTA